MANPFYFLYIVGSCALSVSLAPEFQANYCYFNEIERSDNFALNDEPLLFLTHRGEPSDPASDSYFALPPWIDGPMSGWTNLESASAPLYRKTRAFSTHKGSPLWSNIPRWVHFRAKTVFCAGHFVIVALCFHAHSRVNLHY